MRRILAALALLASGPVLAAAIPRECLKYRRDLVRNARQVWGLAAPVATLGAQMYQESGCNAQARSKYASGLTQFTPDTANWIGGVFPELVARDPSNPVWAIRAMVRYDKWLFDRAAGNTECDSMWFALWGYNGGEGWVQRDRRLASVAGRDPGDFRQVEPYNAGRAGWAFKENRGYPRAIVGRWQRMFIDAGWGAGSCI